MAPFPAETTPCNLYVNQILTPDQALEPRCQCQAIVLTPATGPRFFQEMGKPNGQRTQVVFMHYPASCEFLINSNQCPELNPTLLNFSS